MGDTKAFNRLKSIIKEKGEYIKSDTIGGRWTTECLVYKDITLQIMDEGYTSRIIVPNTLDIVQNYDNTIVFNFGDTEILDKIINNIMRI